ncbi:hypothetical protein EG329_010063 [Mollisiaceae sp. DMI_Dod_QoI]|nr:hypothetical protein EG329_010063 [Helotiales sp. DMI_Dod_QoI]
MATSIVQAAEQVVLEAATNVATGILSDKTGDLKKLENSVAKEAVHATNDDSATFLSKVEGAAEIVANEVVKGAQNVVTAVEQHPELLAEGGLAIAVGAISLIQPEFLAGEVAIIGKMAGDSAKTTLTKIAQDEGTKVVQAISKDAAEDAAKADSEAAKVKEATDKAIEAPSDAKMATETPKDGLSAGETAALGAAIAAKVSPDQTGDKLVTLELDQPGPADGSLDSATHHPITLKVTVGADGQVKGVAQTVVDQSEEIPKAEEPKSEDTKTTVLPETEEGKKKDETQKEEPSVPKDLAPEVSKAQEDKSQEAPKTEAATAPAPIIHEEKPVSLNITIGADGQIQAVAQTVVNATSANVEASKSEQPIAEEVEESKPVKTSSTEASVHVETTKEAISTKEIIKEAEPEAIKEVVVEPAVEKQAPKEPLSTESSAPIHPETVEHVTETLAPAESDPVAPTHAHTEPVVETKLPATHQESDPVHEEKPVSSEAPLELTAAGSSLAALETLAEAKSVEPANTEEKETVAPIEENSVLVVHEEKPSEPIKEEHTESETAAQVVPQHEEENPATIEPSTRPESEERKEGHASAVKKSSGAISKENELETPAVVEESPTKVEMPQEKTEETPAVEQQEEKAASEEDHVPAAELEVREERKEEPPTFENAQEPATSEEVHLLVAEPIQTEEVIPETKIENSPTHSEEEKEEAIQEASTHAETHAPVSQEPDLKEDEPISKDIVETKAEDVKVESLPTEPVSSEPKEIQKEKPVLSTILPEAESTPVIQETPESLEKAVEPSTPLTKPSHEEKPIMKETVRANGESSVAAEPIYQQQPPEVTITAPTPVKSTIVTQKHVDPAPVLKEIEPVVETTQAESVPLEEASSSVAPSTVAPVVQEQFKEPASEPVISKAAEELPKDPISKDIPLQFTVEHVHETTPPPKEKPEAKELTPTPSTTSETKASEITPPAAVVGAVATVNIAEAVSAESKSTPSPKTVVVSQESLEHLHSKIDTINEALQQLTRTLASQAAAPLIQPVVQTKAEPIVAKEIEPVVAKEAVPIDTKSPEPAIPTSSEPAAVQTSEPQAPVETPRPITVTVKSVENVKPSPPTPKTADEPASESSKAVDTVKPMETIDPAPATPTSPTVPSTSTAAKRSSVWKYLWPFGGSSSQTAEPSKDDKPAPETAEATPAEAPSTPQVAA